MYNKSKCDKMDRPNRGIAPLLWFVCVVVGIILIAWFFYHFVAKEEYEIDPDKDGIKKIDSSVA